MYKVLLAGKLPYIRSYTVYKTPVRFLQTPLSNTILANPNHNSVSHCSKLLEQGSSMLATLRERSTHTHTHTVYNFEWKKSQSYLLFGRRSRKTENHWWYLVCSSCICTATNQLGQPSATRQLFYNTHMELIAYHFTYATTTQLDTQPQLTGPSVTLTLATERASSANRLKAGSCSISACMESRTISHLRLLHSWTHSRNSPAHLWPWHWQQSERAQPTGWKQAAVL